jgi:hypothetical protein
MQKIIVSYFDGIKYEKEWISYLDINSNINFSPSDFGFSSYLKLVEVETQKYILTDINDDKASVLVNYIEIDNDYLYVDLYGVIYSHINTFEIGNLLYKKYKCDPLVDFNKYIIKNNRDLKLKNLSL